MSTDPTRCAYAPPGEYTKDHTLVLHEGWWHLYSISGTAGYYHGYNGNEETFSWSISRDLVNWEFRGHVMHPSQRPGTYDQHEVWAPNCIKANGRFYLFYTGIVHPHRPMEYRRLGSAHPWVFQGHRETQGLAVSDDLTDWVKVDDPQRGLGIPGRDSHVVRDGERWLLYSTGQGSNGMDDAYVSQSSDLVHWKFVGVCARFPKLDPGDDHGGTVEKWPGFSKWAITTESLFVMRHPITGKWILMGNWQYAISDDPIDFTHSEVRPYEFSFEGQPTDMGFACEIIEHEGRWYRSGTFGKVDHWQLGFTEIQWQAGRAFTIIRPSILS